MRHSSERGFALAGAILAMVVIASLVAGAFFAARQEFSIGRAGQSFQRSFDASEAGLNQTIAAWNANINSLNMLAVGDSTGPFVTSIGGGVDSSFVTRLNDQLFLVRTIGRDPTGTSRRMLAALTRLQLISMDINAGLTTQGALRIGGSSFIDGRDDPPLGWGCPTSGLDTLAGILIQDSTQITTSGCGGWSCVNGSPLIENDPTIDDSTFFKFGDLDWTELVAMATLTLSSGGTWTGAAPVGTLTTCNTTDQLNWGEPFRPALVAGCVNYFPIIYNPGSMHISGGRGQGILLVEGDLDVQGGFEFFGPVIIRGSLNTAGTGGHFNGGVMAANVNLDQSDVLGNAVITYSSCAILRALNGNSPGRLLGSRSWAEVTY